MSVSIAEDGAVARTRRRPITIAARLAPLIWVGPALALIIVVVLWPVVIMVHTAFQHISPDGFILGSAGWKNFVYLWQEPDLVPILLRTVIWVATIVIGTMSISLVMAQLFNQKFPGRRAARWALIAPWAASVMMTAIVFRWGLNANNGVINIMLHDLGLLKSFNSDASDWLGTPTSAMVWMIIVAIFVSIPFSTYALLAGLQAIPTDVYEAARVDGAGAWRTYVSITLPLLRPAFIVALLINMMNVFNSFPIIWEMTRGGPGHQTSTTTTFMYQLKQSYIGESAAMSVVNFGLVILIVIVYLRATVWNKEAAS
ncbi:carbohydrate ABC transporter permease [Acidisoma cladoniae]|jgi:multiple sugar transport system permease protein|uniref:carbohydrate ABC transporter permease n=1 Tax=Acidisoma cladoniae TaxID=3040935 RepID=UPI00254C15B4|nr:sugar ABC transporter permease [Acidisoma sp. PAMC 29798]